MLVKELIEVLNKMPQEYEVKIDIEWTQCSIYKVYIIDDEKCIIID